MTAALFNSIDIALSAFQRRIAASSSGIPITTTGACPRNGETHNFVQRYTFDVDDLMSRTGNEVVVHHGHVPENTARRLHSLYNAQPILYADRTLGRLNLTRQLTKEILEGKITDWSTVGYRRGPIKVLCHTGSVQKQVFNVVATRVFAARNIRSDLAGENEYEELAATAAQQEGCLVFGLRPEYAPAQLEPVSIDGCWPGTALQPNDYPSLPVWISVPENCAIADLVQYLDIVAGRMEADVRALRRLGESIAALNAA
ncbi:MAG TPA: hypothetical protein VKY22_16710 [Bradyrhizobium sp.]|nr:hypothetical protein [Bradyrhizobium sp.]